MPNLEEEFEEVAEAICPKIAEQLKIAELAIRAAIAYAEEAGMPFYSNVSTIGQPYVPKSFHQKWDKIDKNMVATFTDIIPRDLECGSAWDHSQNC